MVRAEGDSLQGFFLAAHAGAFLVFQLIGLSSFLVDPILVQMVEFLEAVLEFYSFFLFHVHPPALLKWVVLKNVSICGCIRK